MAKVFFALALMAVAALASPALAGGGNDQGGNNNNQGNHSAPAPEIGASAIGMALAVGLAAYARRRRQW
jgi:MYXO-CTERM domain-containing protein